MARIFISHNSQDAKEAVALKRWLTENGWDDVFLDIDAKQGLSPGERWKDALRTAADRCEAVLCLVSPTWLASAECKLEFRYAEQLRKHLFLAIIKPCEKSDLPPDWQWCPLYGDGAQTTITFEFREQPDELTFLSEGLQRLKNGIEKAGISAEHFPWPPANDPDRAPYRGLKPLEAVDAAVFFGRNADILRGMETLRDMRATGIERLLVILGASGSGKSSFMRARLLPRLTRDDSQFFPLPVIRPRNAVLFGADGLAPALATAFSALERNLTLGEVEKWLQAGPEAAEALLAKLEQRLHIRHEDEEEPMPPSLVLTIDQAEELFNPDGSAEAAPFLEFLGRLLIDNQESLLASAASYRRLLVVLTIRSDRYERLQTATGISEINPRLFDLRPFPPGQFERVINGPAERATHAGRKLTIEPKLSERLLADFTEGADTLPLLGFALEKLYHKYGGDGDLTLTEYESIRGSHESVQAAIFQEAIDNALAEPYRTPMIPADLKAQMDGLRRAFIPYLARINPETNEPMRQVAKLAELPADVHPLVERLVEARLLIRDKDTIEVAHESLLRQWPILYSWLVEDRDKLRLLETIRQAASEWTKYGQSADLLIHRDGRLMDAENLLASPGYVVANDSEERTYLSACAATQQAREDAAKDEQERRIRDAERIAKISRSFAYTAGVAIVIVTLLGLWAYRSKVEAQMQTQRANAGRLAIVAGKETNHIDLALLIAKEAVLATPDPTLEAQSALLSALLRHPHLIKIFREHQKEVYDLAFSPDGKRLATGSGGVKSVQIWDAVSGKPLGAPQGGNNGEVFSVAFSTDGKHLATAGGWGKTICLWDTETDLQLATCFNAYEKLASGVAFSPDSKLLASSGDNTVKLWDVATGNALDVPFEKAGGDLYSVAFSPDGRHLVSGGRDTMQIWDVANGKNLGILFEKVDDEVRSVAFSPHGERIAAVLGKTVRLWDAESGNPVGKSIEHKLGDGIKGIAFSPDGNCIATANGTANTVQIWDAESGEALGTPLSHEEIVWSVAFSPDGTRLASASSDGTVRLWDAKSGLTLRVPFEDAGSEVLSVTFSPDGKRLATGQEDGTIRLWDAVTGKLLGIPFPDQDNTVKSLAFSPDGKRLAFNKKMAVAIWDVSSGTELHVPFEDTDDNVMEVTFSPDGKRIAAVYGRAVRLWDAESGKFMGNPMEQEQGDKIKRVDFSPDGKRLAVTRDDNTVRFWVLENGQPLGKPLKKAGADKVTLSPDGKVIASADFKATSFKTVLRLWNAESGEPVGFPFVGHDQWVDTIIFSPDGRLLASSSYYGELRVWDVATGQAIGVLPSGSVTSHSKSSISFSSDGKRLAYPHGNTVMLWDLDPYSWQQRACVIANRNLTHEEWRKYMGDQPYHKTCRDLPEPENVAQSEANGTKPPVEETKEH